MEPQSVDSLGKALSWVVSNSPFRASRDGSQAIGTTLERILDTDGPDTAWTPDLGVGIELKTYNRTATTPMTLFCREPVTEQRKCWNASLIERYGTETDEAANEQIGVYGGARESESFDIEVTDRQLTVYGADGRYCAHYQIDSLTTSALSKLKHLAVVEAEKVELEDGGVGYRYTDATYYADPITDAWNEAFSTGDIALHLRMGMSTDGDVRNHGTAWRIAPERLSGLYKTVVDLLDPNCDLTTIPLPQQTLDVVDQSPTYNDDEVTVSQSQGTLDDF